MTLNLQEVARAVGAAERPPPLAVAGWSVDTRTQKPGDVYFALRGPNHDGHNFLAAAIEKGAAALVVEGWGRLQPAGWGRLQPANPSEARTAPCELVVPDTERALRDLASWARKKWGGRVIGVTGSAGKTTTKDAIAHLLETELPVGKTIGNFNNHVGVPLSLLRLPDACLAGVIEIGMNHAGEIRQLAAIAKPDIGVVTNVGYAHAEFFDSIEGIAAAKRELIEGLPPDGVAVLNADDPRVSRFREVHPGRSVTFGFSEDAEVRAENVEFGATAFRGDAARFRTLGVDFVSPMSGRHAVMNLLAAIAVAHVFQIAPDRLRPAVASFTVGNMRGQRTLHRGIVIWNDCYNSNPEAAQSMLDVLRETPAVRRIAVLGEMLELGLAGEELHRQVGRYAGRCAAGRVDLLIGVRGAARAMVEAAAQAGVEAQFFEDPAEAGDRARQVARSGDAVLFKGSRGVKVEKALERFTA
jgi:UDP-N-acetylmuramoyl-tripeptide--D-alanyl-D-alanine ligase